MFLYIHLDFFAIGTKTIDTVRKLPLFVTVLGSGSAATANVCEVSELRVESCSIRWCTAQLWKMQEVHTYFYSRQIKVSYFGLIGIQTRIRVSEEEQSVTSVPLKKIVKCISNRLIVPLLWILLHVSISYCKFLMPKA